MKKIILMIIMSLSVIKVKAFTLEYSEWVTEYPKNVEEILIESEKRYQWYKENEINIEYLKRAEIKDKNVNYDDYKLTEEVETIIEPEENEDLLILKKYKNYTFSENDIDGLKIMNMYFKNNVYFSEIEVINLKTNEQIKYKINEEYKSLTDNNYYEYIKVGTPPQIIISFDKKYNIDDLKVKIYYKCDGEDYNSFSYNFTSYIYCIYNKTEKLSTCENCKLNYQKENVNEQLSFYMPVYTFQEKLYKTYDIEKEYINEYYKELEGYKKIEESEKMFYRYITNDYIITNVKGEIVKDLDYCEKSACTIKYIIKPEEEIIEEIPPKTEDIINKNIILLMFSLISLIIIIKVEKSRTKNKSNKVENLKRD